MTVAEDGVNPVKGHVPSVDPSRETDLPGFGIETQRGLSKIQGTPVGVGAELCG